MDQAPTLQERQVVALEGIQAAMWVLIHVMESQGPREVEDDEPDMFATLNGPRTSLERCQCGRTDGPSSFVRGDGKLVCIQCCEMESMK